MGDARRNLWIVPTYTEAAPHVRAALDWCLDRGVPFTGFTGPCGVPPCFFGGDRRYLPDLRAVDAAERTGAHTYVAACDECSLRASCLGVRREYLALYGEAAIEPVAAG
jgi:hypothetical protein